MAEPGDADTNTDPAGAALSGRAAVVFAWTSAFAFYVLAYASAIRLSYGYGYVDALLCGFANAWPDAAAAPLVLRAAAAWQPGRPRAFWRLALLAPAFVAWSLLVSALGLAAIYARETGVWKYTLDVRSAAWKVLLSLLAFCVLAGIGLARHHSRRAREASARAMRSETLRAEARLAILRAQLNPHFILNVLQSLVGLVERDPPAAAGALERLGTTLRYALRVQSRGTDRVPLRDELAFTREYLELERLRLGERLETRISVDEAALDRIVPPFVLQPLVENAVIHAIAPRARGGVLSLDARLEDGGAALRLAVEDDGPGIAGEERREASRGEGLGLRLLRDRLGALYGAAASLAIDPSPLGGTRVSLRLPAEADAPASGDGE